MKLRRMQMRAMKPAFMSLLLVCFVVSCSIGQQWEAGRIPRYPRIPPYPFPSDANLSNPYIRTANECVKGRSSYFYYKTQLPINVHLDEQCVNEIRKFIRKHPTFQSYHLLLLLLSMKSDVGICDEDLTQIFASGLWELYCYDDWGSLESNRVASRNMLNLGETIIPFLVPLLDDRSRIFLSGSATSTECVIDMYRKCDYAYRYISEILGYKYKFSRNPEVRDKHIDELKDSEPIRQLLWVMNTDDRRNQAPRTVKKIERVGGEAETH